LWWTRTKPRSRLCRDGITRMRPTGCWQQVVQFVEAHTGARSTHGLCPECVIKLYGGILSEEQ
jgi:hypothetical protein